MKTNTFYKKTFFWLNIIALLVLVLFFLSLFLHHLTAFNQDLGRHLKLGQIILDKGRVPLKNLFSYTYPDFPFINHHWMPELVFYFFAHNFGFNSLIILKLALYTVSFFMLFFYVKKISGWPKALSIGFLVLWFFHERTEVRPEMFSFLFLSFYFIALNSKKIWRQYYYLLPLIQLLWVNSHIYFFLGPVLLTFKLISAKLHSKPSKKIFLVLIASLGACLLNPNFLKGALYPLFVFNNYGYQVVENQSFLFMSSYIGKIYNPFLLILVFLSLLSYAAALKKQTFFSWSSFIFFTIFGFLAVRNIPVYVQFLFIPLSKNLFYISNYLKKRIDYQDFLSLKMFFYFLFVPILLFLSWQRFSNQIYLENFSLKRSGFGNLENGKKGVEFILQNKIQPPVFNNFDIGSYLIYKLYPQQQVFVDGRPEAYPADFFKNIYIPMQADKKIWQKIDKKYNFNYIFFNHTDITPWSITFLKNTILDKNWSLVYLDDFIIVFLKNNQTNKNIINRFEIKKDNFNYNCQGQIDCYARIKRIINTLNI
jgi:hypothetical protein